MELISKLHTSSRWIFSNTQLVNSPSRKDSIDYQRESRYRRESASLISDAGKHLNLPTGVINTAVVFMHRFYMSHSFDKFPKYSIAATALFLAGKVGDNFIKFSNISIACQKVFGTHKVSADLIECGIDEENVYSNETLMLQTLGFDVEVEHPHPYIIQLLKFTKLEANKEFTKTCYNLATQIIHRTTFCLEFEASVIACVAIYSAIKRTNLTIPKIHGRDWYYFVNSAVNLQLLEELDKIFGQVQSKSVIQRNNYSLVVIENCRQEYHEYLSKKSLKSKLIVDLPIPKFDDVIKPDGVLWKGGYVLMDRNTHVNKFEVAAESVEAEKRSSYKERYIKMKN